MGWAEIRRVGKTLPQGEEGGAGHISLLFTGEIMNLLERLRSVYSADSFILACEERIKGGAGKQGCEQKVTKVGLSGVLPPAGQRWNKCFCSQHKKGITGKKNLISLHLLYLQWSFIFPIYEKKNGCVFVCVF